MLVKCICTNCAGHLEFEEENAGEKIKCPHCHFETTLFLPGEEPADSGPEHTSRWPQVRSLLLRFGIPILVLIGLGFAAYHWILPPLTDWLPNTDSVVLPVGVLIFACVLFLLAIAWVIFPILLLLQVRKALQLLAILAGSVRPVLSVETEQELEPEAASTEEVEETEQAAPESGSEEKAPAEAAPETSVQA
jgi:hypothetical protein